MQFFMHIPRFYAFSLCIFFHFILFRMETLKAHWERNRELEAPSFPSAYPAEPVQYPAWVPKSLDAIKVTQRTTSGETPFRQARSLRAALALAQESYFTLA